MTATWILAVGEPASAPVTQWPLRIGLVLVVVGIIALVLLAMRRGWVRRARSQSSIPAPAIPASVSPGAAAYGGVFLGSTSHGDWLDRIVVHDLGVRSRVEIEVDEHGVCLWRQGARDLFIPAGDLRGGQAARGIAGKAYERDGVVVITWELGGRLIDTGLRADAADDQRALLAAIMATVQGRSDEVSR